MTKRRFKHQAPAPKGPAQSYYRLPVQANPKPPSLIRLDGRWWFKPSAGLTFADYAEIEEMSAGQFLIIPDPWQLKTPEEILADVEHYKSHQLLAIVKALFSINKEQEQEIKRLHGHHQ